MNLYAVLRRHGLGHPVAAVAVAAVFAVTPATATARINLDPVTPAHPGCCGHVTGAGAPAGAATPAASLVPRAAVPSPGFRFGDAGIGAAVVLLLVGAGTTANAGRRRRGHHPTTG